MASRRSPPEVEMVASDAQDVGVDTFAQAGIERVFAEYGDLGEQLRVESAAADGGQPEQVAGRTRQGIDPCQEQVAQRTGEGRRPGLQQFLGVQRVSLTPGEQGPDEGRVSNAPCTP